VDRSERRCDGGEQRERDRRRGDHVRPDRDGVHAVDGDGRVVRPPGVVVGDLDDLDDGPGDDEHHDRGRERDRRRLDHRPHVEPRELTVNLAWYVSRAAGLVSWVILALAILWGLLLSSSVLGRHPGPRWLLDVHRFLGGLAVVFVAVHVLALLADHYVSFTPTQLLVPFASSYRPGAVAAGVVALYLLVAVEVTSLVRRWIPKRLWRGVHLLSYGLFVLGTGHLLTAGTDATEPAVLAAVVATTTTVVVGTVAHVVRRRRGPVRSRRRVGPSTEPPPVPGLVPVGPSVPLGTAGAGPAHPPVREPSLR